MEKRTVRQGDILFVPVSDAGQTEADKREEQMIKDGIVARGEATGHNHRLAVLEAAEVYTVGWQGQGGMRLKVGPDGVSILHEEHRTVQLEPNTTYEVRRAREYDYLANIARPIRD